MFQKKNCTKFQSSTNAGPEILSPSSTLCTIKDVQSFVDVNETIRKRFTLNNEGFSTVICGNILAHVVDHLHSPEEKKFVVNIFSVVKEVPEDRRNNKDRLCHYETRK